MSPPPWNGGIPRRAARRGRTAAPCRWGRNTCGRRARRSRSRAPARRWGGGLPPARHRSGRRHAAGVGQVGDGADRVDRADGVGNVGQPPGRRVRGPIRGGQLVERQLAVVGDRERRRRRAPCLLAQHLPGDDFEWCSSVPDQHLVAGTARAWGRKKRTTRLMAYGRATHEHQHSRTCWACTKPLRGRARPLVGGAGPLGQGVQAAVDVAPALAEIRSGHRRDHRRRHLGGGGVVEVGERPARAHAPPGRENRPAGRAPPSGEAHRAQPGIHPRSPRECPPAPARSKTSTRSVTAGRSA